MTKAISFLFSSLVPLRSGSEQIAGSEFGPQSRLAHHTGQDGEIRFPLPKMFSLFYIKKQFFLKTTLGTLNQLIAAPKPKAKPKRGEQSLSYSGIQQMQELTERIQTKKLFALPALICFGFGFLNCMLLYFSYYFLFISMYVYMY